MYPNRLICFIRKPLNKNSVKLTKSKTLFSSPQREFNVAVMSEKVWFFLAGKESEIGIETSDFTYNVFAPISIFQSKFFIYFIKLTGLILKFIYSEKTLKCDEICTFFLTLLLKGQLISKANSKLFTSTKKPTKIFLYFCPSLQKWSNQENTYKINIW